MGRAAEGHGAGEGVGERTFGVRATLHDKQHAVSFVNPWSGHQPPAIVPESTQHTSSVLHTCFPSRQAGGSVVLQIGGPNAPVTPRFWLPLPPCPLPSQASFPAQHLPGKQLCCRPHTPAAIPDTQLATPARAGAAAHSWSTGFTGKKKPRWTLLRPL